jgi:hypothetical protein
MRYLIWSNEHKGWWRPNRNGYTEDYQDAGLYSRDNAMTICKNASLGWREGEPLPEILVSEADALEIVNHRASVIESEESKS